MTQDANELLMGGGIKSAKLDVLGATVVGTITETPKVSQLTKFGLDGKPTAELDYWPSGDPKMQIVLTLATDYRDPGDPDDDGKRHLFIPPRMMPYVRDAIKAAGAKGLAIGGRIAVRWISGTGQGQGNPKVYAAEYAPPVLDPGSMLAAPATAAAPPAAPMLTTPAAPVAAAPPPATSPTMGSLLATPPPSQAPAPQGVDPVMWASLPDASRAAILAAMANPANTALPF